MRIRRSRFSVSAAVAGSWGSSVDGSRTAVMSSMVGRSARPDLPVRDGLLRQVRAARAPGRAGHLDHVHVGVAAGEHVQLADLLRRRRARPGRGTAATGTSPRSRAAHASTAVAGSSRPRVWPRRQRQQGAGEPVAAQVGGLPGRLGPPRGERRRDRPADLGAAAVAPAVGADQPERAVVRREVALEVERRAGPRRRAARRCARRSPRRRRRAWKTRTPGPELAAVTADQLDAHAGAARRGGRAPRSGSRLSATALRPHDPGVLDEQELGLRRGGAGRSARRRRGWRRSSGSRSRRQSAVHPRSRPHPRPADGPVRAGRCAARSPPPRCGRRRRAWPGCWRRGPTRSWWR